MSYLVDSDLDDEVNDIYDDDLEGESFRRRRRRNHAPSARPIQHGPGVDSVAINTPKGSAQIRMPKPLASQEDLQNSTNQLEDAIGRASQRASSTQADVEVLAGRVRKLKKEQAQQNMMTLMLTLLGQRDLQKQIDAKADRTGAVTVAPADDKLSQFLPFLLMGNQGGDAGGMNPLLLALIVAGR